MPTLQIRLFGDFQLLYDGNLIPNLHQARLQSLLAYLVLHRDAPQARQRLAFLFWPDSSEAQAHANLRQLLHRLQRVLPAAHDFLRLDTKTVQWRADAAFTLDVAEFECHLAFADEAAGKGDEAAVRTALQTAVATYQGDLLRGCYDEWVLPERERWQTAVLRSLERLILVVEAQREYAAAIRYAQHLLRYDPLHETTYRHLMRLHALQGDRAGALRVYHTCATLLQRELGVEPSLQTRLAYEQLLKREIPPALSSTQATAQPIQSVPAAGARTTPQGAHLIGRQAEWQKLLTSWRMAASGHAHCLVIAGEAGIGKTRLAEELTTWVSNQGIRTAHTRVYAAEGALAYAPVTEWLRTEAVQSGWQGLETVWLTELARLLPELLVNQPRLRRPEPLRESWQRKLLFEALARAMLAANLPLLLVLDDLQWCDRETLEWLHYLLRYAPAAPLLILGTVRPEEVGREHPWTTLLLELRSAGRVSELELSPLTLDETAALAAQLMGQTLLHDAGQRLYQQTEGNPLFVLETVRAELSQSAEEVGHDEALFLSTRFTPKVQAVIQRRLAQLSPTALELIRLAAVIGRSFTLDLLVQASELAEDTLMYSLDELWQRRLVREQGGTAYDFSHDRIRDVAYSVISPVLRQLLHRRVAQALEAMHPVNLDAVISQVAVHYEQAGLTQQAIDYYQQAGEVARRIGAYDDSIVALNRCLALLAGLPVTREQQQKELSVLMALGTVWGATKGKAALESGDAYARACDLCQCIGDQFLLFVAQQELRTFHGHRGAWMKASQLAEANLALAEELGDLELLQYARLGMGITLHHTGRLRLSHAHLKQAINQPLPLQRRFDHLFFDHARIASLRNFAVITWLLGYPDQARAQRDEGLMLAQNETPVIRLAMTLRFAAMLDHCLREVHWMQQRTTEMEMLCTKYGFSHYLTVAALQKGWVLVMQGEWAAGIEQLRTSLHTQTATGLRLLLTYEIALLVEAYGMAGRYTEGLAACHEALAIVEQTGECFWQAELLRLQGEFKLAQGATVHEVESDYWQAIDITRQQSAKSLELRAVMSLARLWQRQGKRTEAHHLLSTIYAWFTEGFDTLDLQEAQGLLQELSSS